METTWKPSDVLMQIDRKSIVNWSKKTHKNCHSISAFWCRFPQVICLCWCPFLFLHWKSQSLPEFLFILSVRCLVVLNGFDFGKVSNVNFLLVSFWWSFMSVSVSIWWRFLTLILQTKLIKHETAKRNELTYVHLGVYDHQTIWIYELASAVFYRPYVLVDVILMLFYGLLIRF